MKTATKTILSCAAAAALVGTANAAVTVTQSFQWSDGNNATNATSATFDLTSGTTAGSLIVATAYVDNTNTTAVNFNSVTFEGAAASAVYSNGRLSAFVFLAPTVGSNTLSFAKSTNSGIGWIIYEISGANNATITIAQGATTIDTTTANELVLSFAGRNGAAPTENTTLFTGADQTIAANTIRGTGTLTSASAIAPTIGSQDITWTTNDGTVSFAFEAAAIPEPSTALLGGLGLLALLRRRR